MNAGQFMVVGLPGKILEPQTAKILEQVQPGGILLLPKNIEEQSQVRELIAAVEELLPETVWYLDAEGGRVDRLRQLVAPAPSGSVLAALPPAFAKRAGRWVGGALAAFGFQVDFAPVVDLNHGLANNALDDRYLGQSATEIESRARAFLEGLETAGVAGCLKHFPGLGAAREDTHFGGSSIASSLVELAADLHPYQRLGARAGAAMINHASYPSIDPSGRPASLSAPLATGLLRRHLAFRGLLFSDDLDMNALAPWGSPAERAEQAFAAGCDVVCLCHSVDELVAAERKLSGASLANRREESGRRLVSFRRRLAVLGKRRRQASLEAVRRGLAQLARDAAALGSPV